MEKNQEIILKTNSKSQAKIFVHSDITKHLKTHQIDGIKFLFENCFEKNSGCILAHHMGLGKTLQAISLLHATINSSEYPTNKILVLCTVSTISNWKEEIVRWLAPINDGHRKLQIYELEQKDDIHRKISYLQKWSQCDSKSPAACLIMGYDAFRNLVNFHSTKANAKKYTESGLRQIREHITNFLLKPADIVICDEGHVIKNVSAGITIAVNQIQTTKRIVLTGTPMQNNLMEYYSMVNFVKPNFLGTKQYFNEYFAEPIKAGQHADSCEEDIKYMKQRSFALNKKLSKIVQRREISLLKDFLPEKFEFVLFVPLTEIQYKLYKHFLDNRGGTIEQKRLFGDYTCLRKIWTHLKVLESAHQKSVAKKRRVTNSNDDDESANDDEEQFASSGELQLVDNDWWRKVIDKGQLESALSSHKMILMFEILKECQRVGDKCLIFSSFVQVLNVVEHFMQQIDQKNEKAVLGTFVGPWKKNEDYYRLDGSTPKERRHSMITKFNDVNNKRTKVFLISSLAGGLGVNLFGANRLILLDTSWNPSKDQQSIFRIYRMGQTKHCYIYRLLSMGTMEEKIYSRSVTKQAMSCRVVDKQQIDRHFSMNELYELYSLTKTNMAQRPVSAFPKDNLLAYLLQKCPNMIYKYLEHDSLLENKVEEELNDVEKNLAWQRCQEQNFQMQAHNNMFVEPHTVTSSSSSSQGVTFRVPVTKPQNQSEENTLKWKEKLGKKTDPLDKKENSSSIDNQLADSKFCFSSQSTGLPVESHNQMEVTTLESKEPLALDMGEKIDDSLENKDISSLFGDEVATFNDTLLANKVEEVLNDVEKDEATPMTYPSHTPNTKSVEEQTSQIEKMQVLVESQGEMVASTSEWTESSLSTDVKTDDSSYNNLSVSGELIKSDDTLLSNKAEEVLNDVDENEEPNSQTFNNMFAEQQRITSSSSQSPKSKVLEKSENRMDATDVTTLELKEPLTVSIEEKTDVASDKNEHLSFHDQLADSRSSFPSQSPVIQVLAESQNGMDVTTMMCKEPLTVDINKNKLSSDGEKWVDKSYKNTGNIRLGPFRNNEMIQEYSMKDEENTFVDDQNVYCLPSPVCCNSRQRLAESNTTATSSESTNENSRELLPVECVDNENHDTIEERVTRSLAAYAKDLLHTLNVNYAVRSLQQHQNVPFTIDDYAIEEDIVSSKKFQNLEYHIAFKRPADSNIRRPIKKLKLSLEIDSTVAAITVDQTLSTLPTRMIHDTMFMEHPQLSNDENSTSNDIHFESNVECLNGAEHSKHVTVLLSTNSPQDNIDLKDTIEPISTLKPKNESGSNTSLPLNDVMTKSFAEDEEIFPKCVDQQPKELVTGLTSNDERPLRSSSMDTDASNEFSPDNVEQLKKFTVNCAEQQSLSASIHSEVSDSSTEEMAMSSNIFPHLDNSVAYERYILAYSNCRTYRHLSANEENSLADTSEMETFSAYEQDLYVEDCEETDFVPDADSMFDHSNEQPSTFSKIKEACALM